MGGRGRSCAGDSGGLGGDDGSPNGSATAADVVADRSEARAGPLTIEPRRTMKVVCPARRRSPFLSRASVTRSSLTNVPFRLSRSRTRHISPSKISTKWRPDMYASAPSAFAVSEVRPISISRPGGTSTLDPSLGPAITSTKARTTDDDTAFAVSPHGLHGQLRWATRHGLRQPLGDRHGDHEAAQSARSGDGSLGGTPRYQHPRKEDRRELPVMRGRRSQ